MSVACILVAAGRGERLGSGRPKALVEVAGHPVLWHAARTVAASGAADELVVVVPATAQRDVESLVRPVAGALDVRVVVGGATRQASVAAGLSALSPAVDVVLVHDAARCLATTRLVEEVAEAVRRGARAVVPGIPLADTVKQIDADGVVVATPDRASLRAVQTPQGFRRDVLERAHEAATQRGEVDATDDAGLVERAGLPVRVVPGDPGNIKVTRPLDLLVAEAVLSARTRGS